MLDVITFGAATRDVFLRSKNFRVEENPKSSTDKAIWLPLGSKLEIEDVIFETGGGATNTAVTFARQGLRAGCICRVGDDPEGKIVIESLADEGVKIDLIVRDRENYTGYSVIMVTGTGERTVLVHRGASSHFKDDLVPKNKLETGWLFITSLAGDIGLLRSLVGWAHTHQIKTAIIPGSGELEKGEDLLAPIFALADVVIMNREEAAELTGVPFDQKEKVVHKVCLLTRGVGVVTDAASGATACDQSYFYHIGTHGNKAVSRTGAGDAFASGFVAGLIKSGRVEDALELAADNASSVVNFFGAKKGILHERDHPFKERLQITKQKV